MLGYPYAILVQIAHKLSTALSESVYLRMLNTPTRILGSKISLFWIFCRILDSIYITESRSTALRNMRANNNGFEKLQRSIYFLKEREVNQFHTPSKK